jgi:hypothetical protein
MEFFRESHVEGHWKRAGHWRSTMITPRRFGRLLVINALNYQEAMGTFSRNLRVVHTKPLGSVDLDRLEE